jgi:hypothetical protein
VPSLPAIYNVFRFECDFSKDISYSGLNKRHGLATRVRQEKRAQGRFGFAHCTVSYSSGFN